MAFQPKILALAGSTRGDSLNKKLVRVAAAGARSAGAEVTVVDLRDLAMPLYDQDFENEHGLPEGALELKRLLGESQGMLISSPEYNSSVTGVLKNAIDWASRKATPDEAPLASLAGKAAALMAASPGALGGLRGLVHLRAILGNLRVLLLPEQKAVPKAFQAFADNGSMTDEKQQKAVEALGSGLTELLLKLNRTG